MGLAWNEKWKSAAKDFDTAIPAVLGAYSFESKATVIDGKAAPAGTFKYYAYLFTYEWKVSGQLEAPDHVFISEKQSLKQNGKDVPGYPSEPKFKGALPDSTFAYYVLLRFDDEHQEIIHMDGPGGPVQVKKYANVNPPSIEFHVSATATIITKDEKEIKGSSQTMTFDLTSDAGKITMKWNGHPIDIS